MQLLVMYTLQWQIPVSLFFAELWILLTRKSYRLLHIYVKKTISRVSIQLTIEILRQYHNYPFRLRELLPLI